VIETPPEGVQGPSTRSDNEPARIRLWLLIIVLTSFYATAGCSESDGDVAPNDTTVAVESTTSTEATGQIAPSSPEGQSGGAQDRDPSSTPGVEGESTAGADPGSPPTEDGGSATTATTGLDAVRTFGDPERGFEFAYPADWYLTTDVSAEGSAGGSPGYAVGVFDPRGAQSGGELLDGILVSVYDLDARVDEGLMPEFRAEVEGLLPQLESRLTDLLVVQPLRDTTLNGLPGFELTVTFTNEGTELRNRMLFVVDGSTEYQLTAQAAAADWQRLQSSFDVVLKTFRSTR
jgi:hypothetical protein